MNKNRVTPTIVGDDSASKRKVFFANFDNAGHQGGNATSFARTETRADSFDASGSAAASMTSQCSQSGLAACHNTRGASRNKKFIKIFAASGLAIMMGASVLCGVLIAPMGATSASNAGDLAALAQSADRAQEEWSAGIMSGNLNLDPENDPVVYTTDYGLEIKSHNAGEVPVTTTSPNGTVSVSSTTWHYISAGGYNWIIIGSYSSSSYSISTIRGDEYSGNNPDSTDAGNAVEDANSNGVLYTNVTIPAFTNAVGNSTEIPQGCVLCLCAGTTGSSYFDGSNSYFPGSDLDTAMTTVYNSIKSAANNKILETKLTTYRHNGSAIEKYEHYEYLFPLACSTKWSGYSQNYCVETYLNTNTKRTIGDLWWLRSGSSDYFGNAYRVTANGGIDYGGVSYAPRGVRPAFVLQLYSA